MFQMSICVEFSNPNGVYYPGTEVSGTVVLNLESSIKVSFYTREIIAMILFGQRQSNQTAYGAFYCSGCK